MDETNRAIAQEQTGHDLDILKLDEDIQEINEKNQRAEDELDNAWKEKKAVV